MIFRGEEIRKIEMRDNLHKDTRTHVITVQVMSSDFFQSSIELPIELVEDRISDPSPVMKIAWCLSQGLINHVTMREEQRK